MTNNKRFCLIGTGDNIRQMHYAESTAKLEAWAAERGLDFYAIYRNDAGFHGSHQEEFLVLHRNDPYWTNRGVASAA